MKYLLFFGFMVSNAGYIITMNAQHQNPQLNCPQCIMDLHRTGRIFEAHKLLQRFNSELYDISSFALNNDSLLHYCVQNEMRPYFLKLLLKKGAKLEVRNSAGETPLLASLRSFNYQAAQILIIAGACVNVVDGTNKTPLHWLCLNQSFFKAGKEAYARSGNLDFYKQFTASLILTPVPPLKKLAIKTLLERSDRLQIFNRLIPDLKGEVLFCLLQEDIRFDKWWLSQIEQDQYVIDLFISRIKQGSHCDDFINKKDSDGNTPLHLAARSHAPMVFALYLVRMGANRMETNNAGQTPFDVARAAVCDRRVCGHCDELKEYLVQPIQLIDKLQKMITIPRE